MKAANLQHLSNGVMATTTGTLPSGDRRESVWERTGLGEWQDGAASAIYTWTSRKARKDRALGKKTGFKEPVFSCNEVE